MASDHYLYVMATKSGIYKIGISHDPNQRLRTIKTSSPEPVRLLFSLGCGTEKKARILEKTLHAKLSKHASNGEWFNADKKIIAEAIFDTLTDDGFFGKINENLFPTEPEIKLPLPPRDSFSDDHFIQMDSREYEALCKKSNYSVNVSKSVLRMIGVDPDELVSRN